MLRIEMRALELRLAPVWGSCFKEDVTLSTTLGGGNATQIVPSVGCGLNSVVRGLFSLYTSGLGVPWSGSVFSKSSTAVDALLSACMTTPWQLARKHFFSRKAQERSISFSA
jgi:hypothetical protein